MTFARRIGTALAALVLAPLLAACTFTGTAEVTDQGLLEVDLLMSSMESPCDPSPDPQLMEGLAFEPGEQPSQCRVTGTVSPALAGLLGISVARDEAGLRFMASDVLSNWQTSAADVKIRFPGPITEMEGAEAAGMDEIRVAFGSGETPAAVKVSSRAGYGPSRVEWAAGIGLVAGVALTLLGFGLRRLRRNRLAAADVSGWPAPDGAPAGVGGPRPTSPSDDAFWSGAVEPPAPVVGERTKRPGADPSVWAPPRD